MSSEERNHFTHLPVPEPHFIPGYTGFCPGLSDQVGHSYSWATHIIMKGHPTIGKRLARIKPKDSGTSSPGPSSGSLG
ncbi:hypothetical protein TNCT_104361 [Trichonephila clavata]|uniref:Ciliary microtubule inner protein 2A-C-like domain-containing protein n=1 Tax=Trichonephila clavata TaxID=2740835 RepID=A0A8X6F3J7_TRICU|nr:hypothetical protein TNCT_104361 [Trichonephila clavata]